MQANHYNEETTNTMHSLKDKDKKAKPVFKSLGLLTENQAFAFKKQETVFFSEHKLNAVHQH